MSTTQVEPCNKKPNPEKSSTREKTIQNQIFLQFFDGNGTRVERNREVSENEDENNQNSLPTTPKIDIGKLNWTDAKFDRNLKSIDFKKITVEEFKKILDDVLKNSNCPPGSFYDAQKGCLSIDNFGHVPETSPTVDIEAIFNKPLKGISNASNIGNKVEKGSNYVKESPESLQHILSLLQKGTDSPNEISIIKKHETVAEVSTNAPKLAVKIEETDDNKSQLLVNAVKDDGSSGEKHQLVMSTPDGVLKLISQIKGVTQSPESGPEYLSEGSRRFEELTTLKSESSKPTGKSIKSGGSRDASKRDDALVNISTTDSVLKIINQSNKLGSMEASISKSKTSKKDENQTTIHEANTSENTKSDKKASVVLTQTKHSSRASAKKNYIKSKISTEMSTKNSSEIRTENVPSVTMTQPDLSGEPNPSREIATDQINNLTSETVQESSAGTMLSMTKLQKILAKMSQKKLSEKPQKKTSKLIDNFIDEAEIPILMNLKGGSMVQVKSEYVEEKVRNQKRAEQVIENGAKEDQGKGNGVRSQIRTKASNQITDGNVDVELERKPVPDSDVEMSSEDVKTERVVKIKGKNVIESREREVNNNKTQSVSPKNVVNSENENSETNVAPSEGEIQDLEAKQPSEEKLHLSTESPENKEETHKVDQRENENLKTEPEVQNINREPEAVERETGGSHLQMNLKAPLPTMNLINNQNIPSQGSKIRLELGSPKRIIDQNMKISSETDDSILVEPQIHRDKLPVRMTLHTPNGRLTLGPEGGRPIFPLKIRLPFQLLQKSNEAPLSAEMSINGDDLKMVNNQLGNAVMTMGDIGMKTGGQIITHGASLINSIRSPEVNLPEVKGEVELELSTNEQNGNPNNEQQFPSVDQDPMDSSISRKSLDNGSTGSPAEVKETTPPTTTPVPETTRPFLKIIPGLINIGKDVAAEKEKLLSKYFPALFPRRRLEVPRNSDQVDESQSIAVKDYPRPTINFLPVSGKTLEDDGNEEEEMMEIDVTEETYDKEDDVTEKSDVATPMATTTPRTKITLADKTTPAVKATTSKTATTASLAMPTKNVTKSLEVLTTTTEAVTTKGTR